MHHVSHKVCPRRGRFAKHHVVLIFLRRAPTPELVITIAEWLCVTRTAPHCDRGSLRMANQVATGAGKASAYSTGAGGRSHLGAGAGLFRSAQAGGGSHLADQEASRTARAREVART